MKSIRRHLTLRLVLCTSLLAIGGLLAVFAYLRAELLRRFDDALVSRARTLASLVHVDDDTGKQEFEFVQGPASEYGRTQRPDYFRIWGKGGGELARSHSLGSADLPRALNATAPQGGASFFELTLPDGRAGRAVELRFSPGHEEDPPGTSSNDIPPSATLVLATELAPLHATLRNVLAALLVVMTVVSMGTVLTVVATVRRGLRPLRDIGDAVARVDPMTLDSRLDSPGLPEELRPVAQKLDELLKRLDDAFKRERRFTSNVAHELRTPIAELRTLAEVALQWPADADTSARNNRDVLNISRQMEAMVGALLAIARCQAGHQSLEVSRVDLADVVGDAWRPHATMSESRGLAAEIDVARDTFVLADRTVLAAMLQNLFANAVAYTPAGGRINCRAGRSANANGVTFEIVNTNRTVTVADLPLLTEPFWRKDPARTNPANSGLGLTLVATYAKLLGAEFSASLPAPDLFAVKLVIPAPQTDAAPRERETSADLQPVP